MARLRALDFLAAMVLAMAALMTGASTSLAATTVPDAPWGLSTTTGVDGVTLGWYRGSTQTGGTPTSYVVHRRAAGYDADWVVSTDTTSNSWSYSDGDAPVGVEVTYTVIARNSAGDSSESAPVSARVPAWGGPYTPDRVSLSLVWDEAAGGDETERSTVAADSTSTPALTQGWSNGVSFSAGSWRQALVLPQRVQDGTYSVGDSEGQLQLRAMAGDFCGSGAGGSAPGGTATVSRTAPSMDGLYASISVDATLDCGNGHSLRAQLRWHTPDSASALTSAPLSRMTAEPDGSATTDVTVTNSGSEPLVLGSARLVDAAMSTAAPLSVVASTCAGLTLEPGADCTVTVSYAAGAARSPEGRGVLALLSDTGEWELGLVVGQQPPAYSGPQALAGSSSPGRIDLSWRAPSTLDSRLIASWRVEDVHGGTPVVLQTRSENYLTSTTLRSPATGDHSLRLVLATTDGREVASEPIPLTIASRWLLATTSAGVRAYDADGGVTNGGALGNRTVSTYGISTSPTRKAIVVADSPFSGSVTLFGATGEMLRGLTYDPTFADAVPDVSPDGSKVVLFRAGYTGAQTRPSSLITVPVTGGPVTTVPNSAGLGMPVWTPDGATLIVATGANSGLVRVNPTTGTRTSIAGTTGARVAAVSRTGRLAFALTDWNGSGEIRITSLTGGASTLVGTHPGASDLSWDPTGQWLAITGGPYGHPPTTQLFDLRSTVPTLAGRFPGGTSISWLVPGSAVPASSVASPSWTSSTASVTIGASDPDDAPGGLRRECMLDAGAWTPCPAIWTITGLSAGQHTVSARVTDPSGQVSQTAQRRWSIDTQRPSIALGALPSALTSTGLSLAWTTNDTGGSSVSSVDVRYRSAAFNGSFGALSYPSTWQGLKGKTLTTRLSVGRHYCFSARVRDGASNVSGWSAERCTAVALDDRALTASTGWTRGTSSAYAYGTYTRAKSSGRSLTRTSVKGRRIAVVATTCPTCGAVDVYHAGVKIGRVSLYSAKTSYRQIRWLPLQSVTRTGSVVVRTTSTKTVVVDGIAVWH